MASNTIQIPRRLPLLIVSDNVLLPGSSMRIPVHTLRNMNMVRSRLLGRNTLSSTVIGVVPQEPDGAQGEEQTSLHSIGTAAIVVQITGTNWPKPSYTLLATGLCRFKIDDLLQEMPYVIAKVTQLDKLSSDDSDSEKMGIDQSALIENFREQASMLVDMLDISVPLVAKLKKMLDNIPLQHLPDICTSLVKATYSEKIEVLDAIDITDRFNKSLPLLMRQIETLKLLQKARKGSSTTLVPTVPSRKFAIRSFNSQKSSEIFDDNDDDDDDDGDEVAEFERKIKAAQMSTEAHKAAIKELKRLKKMPQQMPEHAIIRNYLDLMVQLPWNKSTTDQLDILQARNDLDRDHYGLDKLKKRVIEYLAVRQIKNSLKGPILCFVGPPGVGKTSLGRSIASTLGREFHRISLGGVCDQSDIRGHRRTYIGSMPGRIINGLKQVGVKNPVFLLDEIDKLSRGVHGDPSAALLEVLDPEQNNSFVDHYLNVPFDLSQVLFIATANSLSTVPAPLLDRMEIIQVPGYVQEEKLHIAMGHLVPKQLKEHGLTAEHIDIPEDSIKLIISSYTREAGVRTLERRIGALCRAVAVKVAENSHKQSLITSSSDMTKPSQTVESVERQKKGEGRLDSDTQNVTDSGLAETIDVNNPSAMTFPPELPIVIDLLAVEDILGPPMFESELRERLSQPGVATGLAWTALGGEILYVEATQMSGEGKLTLTGQLGDVMKESASLALNWLRSNAAQLGISAQGGDLLENTDVHIHFPAGAISKDGPSAGVTVVSVLVSLFTGRCVRSDTALTGEVTLRGLVLPVGGIKEKVLAAHRAGISRVILPKRNEKDLLEIPTKIQNEMTFILVSRLEDVLEAAFEGGFPQLNASTTVVPSKL